MIMFEVATRYFQFFKNMENMLGKYFIDSGRSRGRRKVPSEKWTTILAYLKVNAQSLGPPYTAEALLLATLP